jgi:UDP-N-acetylmuramoylalanine--D-glutamate ligase
MLENRKVAVIGMGASGASAARLCLARGAQVTGIDRKPATELGAAVASFVGEGGRCVLEADRDAIVAEADIVIVSPGVPSFAALERAAARGVPIYGEVELAYRLRARTDVPVVAVGGTNGKSTTTTLVGALLEAAGKKTFTGGNLGEPFSLHVDEPWDAVVLEVSSFQMERVDAFRPRVAILLNVTDDHLDRYPSFQAYADAKGNSFLQQTVEDLAVVPAGDPLCLAQARRGKARVVTFGAGGDFDVTVDAIIDRRRGEQYSRVEMRLAGAHNAMNVAAALAAVSELGVTAETARAVLREFEGLPHRTTLVAEIHGVRFYDDSKGTNVGASVTALRGLAEPYAILIAGGVDKGGSYGPLVDAMKERARAAVLIGEAAPLIEKAAAGAVLVRRAATMDEAVAEAFALARPNDAVLLSPACSSFDMFRDYKDRGDAFVRAVKTLAVREENKT